MCKILTPVKKVIVYNLKVRAKSVGSGVDIANVKMLMSPAVEEAVLLREAGEATEAIPVSAGVAQGKEIQRTALAIGAVGAILIESSIELQPLAMAKLLKALVDNEQPQLIILGKQAIDDDSNQIDQTLSALASLQQATLASNVMIADGTATAACDVDVGAETLCLTRPVVVTTDLRLNEPRYVTLPNIKSAKKGPLETIKQEDLGVDVPLRLKSPKRFAGVKVPDVKMLIEKLKIEANVLCRRQGNDESGNRRTRQRVV